jgi:hypothetical protein
MDQPRPPRAGVARVVMPKLVHRERVPKAIAAKILRYLEAGHSIVASAEACEIHRDTFYDWCKRGEAGEAGYVEFAKQVRTARARAEIKLLDLVIRAAGRPPMGAKALTWQAAMRILEARNRAEYGRKDPAVEATERERPQIEIRVLGASPDTPQPEHPTP